MGSVRILISRDSRESVIVSLRVDGYRLGLRLCRRPCLPLLSRAQHRRVILTACYWLSDRPRGQEECRHAAGEGRVDVRRRLRRQQSERHPTAVEQALLRPWAALRQRLAALWAVLALVLCVAGAPVSDTTLGYI